MQLINISSGSKIQSSRFMGRRRGSLMLNKHKSAPLTNLTQHFNNIQTNSIINSPNSIHKISTTCSFTTTSSTTSLHQPLNDISNHINQKTQMQSNFNNGNIKMNGDDSMLNNNNVSISAVTANLANSSLSLSSNTSASDDLADLENLIFGQHGNQQMPSLTQHQHFIKQSLEIDAQFKNLIGDRSRIHVLPSVQSNKHHDLHCISPETVIYLLLFHIIYSK